ncbi:MAG: ABC transporter permease [Anaerolineae bacterium]|jgi:putative ABC transport system permease protein|nr:ABC transporter permease [Anaerolineae bacterium]
MRLVEQIRLALRALSVNKLRSALTMLGIIIGVGAVITLLSVGAGVQNLVTSQLQSIGTNLLFVVSGNLDQNNPRGASGLTLSLSDAEAIGDPFNVPDVAAVAPEVLSNAEVSYGKTKLRVSVSGVTPSYATVRNRTVALGSFLDEQDVNSRSRVAVIGSRIAERFFDETATYPVGASIKINNIPFRVIGVLEERGGTGGPGGNQDEVVMVPMSTAHERLFPRFHNRKGEPMLSVVYAQVVSEDRMDAASEEISELLRERHDIRFQDEDDFTVINQQDLLSIFGQITNVLTIFLGAIAGISLLVGGIGIMNIMLVSVTERTREIGLRKAVGAKRRDILLQFLIESVVLSLIGGLLGIALGASGAIGISRLQDDLVAIVTPQSIALATGFSAAVGLFFGIYPATRAARLNPIEALRYE